MSERKHQGQPAGLALMPPISFRRELEALRAQRRELALVRDYTIGGEIEQSTHLEIHQRRERRIGSMESCLRGVRGHIENEFGVSLLKDRASRDFERSR